MNRVYLIPIIFIISLSISLAILYGVKTNLKGCGDLYFPTNLNSLKDLCEGLQKCYEENVFSIHLFHAICFLFLQTWCIPGTVLFNLFGGAVFGAYYGTITCLILNVIGASLSYSLSKLCLKEVFENYKFLRDQNEKLKNLIKDQKDNLIFYMIFLRLFPGSPNWVMNISFPHLNIGLTKFVISLFIGIAPWNFISCSAGGVLRDLTNTKEIMDTKKYLTLIGLASCFLIMPFIKSKLSPKVDKVKEK